MKIKNKYFFLDTFSNAFYAGSKFFYNIVIFSFLINSFPLQDYGIYIFFATLMNQFEFVQSGFSSSLERYIPLYKDKKEASNLIFVVAIVYLTFGLLFSSGVYIVDYYKLFSFLNSNDIYDFLILLIYFVPLIWFFKTFSFALRAFKDFRTENLVNISFLFIEAILVFIAIKNNYKLNEILLINLTCLFLRYLVHTVFVFTRHRFNLFSVQRNSLISQFDKVKSYSFWNFISAISGSIVNVSDKLLVSIFIGPSSLPVYYGIMQFTKLISIVSSIINSSIVPHFSYKISESSNKEFNELALKGTEYTSFILITISSIFILFSQLIFTTISKDYLLDYVLVFNVGLFLYLLIGSREFTAKLYRCKDNSVKSIAKLNLIVSLIYPLLFILLSRFFDLYGAVLSPILSHLLIFPLWIKRVFKTTNLNITDYFKLVISKLFKISLIFTPFYLINSLLEFNQNFIVLFLELIILILSVYFIFKRLIVKIKFSLV